MPNTAEERPRGGEAGARGVRIQRQDVRAWTDARADLPTKSETRPGKSSESQSSSLREMTRQADTASTTESHRTQTRVGGRGRSAPPQASLTAPRVPLPNAVTRILLVRTDPGARANSASVVMITNTFQVPPPQNTHCTQLFNILLNETRCRNLTRSSQRRCARRSTHRR